MTVVGGQHNGRSSLRYLAQQLYDSVSRRYDALLIPETEGNVSIGRDMTGAIVYYSHPTPLEENGNPLSTGK
jgi:hypothetical protein